MDPEMKERKEQLELEELEARRLERERQEAQRKGYVVRNLVVGIFLLGLSIYGFSTIGDIGPEYTTVGTGVPDHVLGRDDGSPYDVLTEDFEKKE